MSKKAIEAKIENENINLMKRLITSGAFYFAPNQYVRNKMKNMIAGKVISSSESLRKEWNIHPEPWGEFVAEFFATGGKVRTQHRYYRQCQTERYEAKQGGDFPPKDFIPVPEIPKGERFPAPEGLEDETEKDESGNAAKVTELERMLEDANREVAEAHDKAKKAEQKAKEAREDKPLTLRLITPNGVDQKITSVHKTMPDLLVRINCGLNVYLVGPAGSGKTTGAEQVAENLGLSFGFMSVGPQTTKSDVFGYKDAMGTYNETEFRRRYENGGVFLFDEIDAAHPGVLTQVNAALAGNACAFPDKMVKRHKDFRCIAAGNTFGTGPDRQYVGRQQLDAASLDRFDFLEWGYDTALELEIAKTLTEDKEVAEAWTKYVQAVRKAVEKVGLRHVVSPRATINGVKLLTAKVDREKVEQTALWKSLKPSEIERVKANMEESEKFAGVN